MPTSWPTTMATKCWWSSRDWTSTERRTRGCCEKCFPDVQRVEIKKMYFCSNISATENVVQKKRNMEKILAIIKNGVLYMRERSQHEMLSDIYDFMDNPQYESLRDDQENLRSDFNEIRKDMCVSFDEYKRENNLIAAL